MEDETGWFALAKRDLERGGETVYIIAHEPLAYSHVHALALEHDRLEREADPSSDIRWFPVRLSEAEIARITRRDDA